MHAQCTHRGGRNAETPLLNTPARAAGGAALGTGSHLQPGHREATRNPQEPKERGQPTVEIIHSRDIHTHAPLAHCLPDAVVEKRRRRRRSKTRATKASRKHSIGRGALKSNGFCTSLHCGASNFSGRSFLPEQRFFGVCVCVRVKKTGENLMTCRQRNDVARGPRVRPAY